MLRLSGGQVESLFDLGLPIEVRELPADLAALDRLLESTALLEPIVRSWDQAALVRGRPTIPMDRGTDHVRPSSVDQPMWIGSSPPVPLRNA